MGGSGELTTVDKALVPTGDECVEALHQMARWSIYALQQEMKNGYLTLPGGIEWDLPAKRCLKARN